MKHTVLIVFAIACAAAARAQILAPDAPRQADDALSARAAARLAALASYPARPFDVLRYDLYMDWRGPLDSVSVEYPGVNTITLVSKAAGLDTVQLDAINMRIDSIRVNGAAVAAAQPDSNESLFVPLDKPYNAGDTITIMIEYTHTSPQERGFFYYDSGMYVGQGPSGDSVFTAARQAYTMSEPLDAHAWMPCMDLPYDKALSEIRVAVPEQYTVSSNGILQGVDTVPGGVVFDWKEDEPIATYLMCASASIFTDWRTNYVRVTNPADTVPIYYYVWHIDSTNALTSYGVYNAAYAFRNIPAIMAGFSTLFGEYPFTKYGMTSVEPFTASGMEHQTITTIIRAWLHPGAGEQGMAHEMMHQWFGDDVTCATWKDIWLNEGFATYGEDLYNEFMFGKNAYMNNLMNDQVNYYHLNPGNDGLAIYDPIGQGRNLFNYATTYVKGGIVLHMLRRMLGDTAYFATMRYYLNKFHFSVATTDDFADAISEAAGRDLHWFVNEWVYGKSEPLYNVTWWQQVQPFNTWNATVQIDQPDTARQLFRMPLPLRLFSPALVTDTVVWDTSRSQQYTFNLPFPIDSIEFDPDYSVLKSPASTVTDVAPAALPRSAALALRATPNPARNFVELYYTHPRGGSAELRVSDALGRIMAAYPLGNRAQGTVQWLTQSAPAGLYFARLATASGTATAEIAVVK